MTYLDDIFKIMAEKKFSHAQFVTEVAPICDKQKAYRRISDGKYKMIDSFWGGYKCHYCKMKHPYPVSDAWYQGGLEL